MDQARDDHEPVERPPTAQRAEAPQRPARGDERTETPEPDPAPEPDPRGLDAMDLTTQILAREGMSVDDLVRAKIHYLAAQDRSLVQQVQLSDAKAATALTLMGVLAVNSTDAAPLASGPFLLMDLLFWALVAACLAATLWSISPRYPTASVRDAIAARDRYSWPGLASDDYTVEDYALFMRDSQPSQLILSMARSNSALSSILLRKFKALRFAFQAGGGAVAVLILRTMLGA